MVEALRARMAETSAGVRTFEVDAGAGGITGLGAAAGAGAGREAGTDTERAGETETARPPTETAAKEGAAQVIAISIAMEKAVFFIGISFEHYCS